MTEKAHNPLSTSLLVLGILCILIGLSPQSRGHTDPETNERITEWALGLNISPFWTYHKRESPNGAFSFKSKLHLFSWSSVLLIVGMVSLTMWHQRRKKRKKG